MTLSPDDLADLADAIDPRGKRPSTESSGSTCYRLFEIDEHVLIAASDFIRAHTDLESAARAMFNHLNRIKYRDNAGLRLGAGHPTFDRLAAALSPTPPGALKGKTS